MSAKTSAKRPDGRSANEPKLTLKQRLRRLRIEMSTANLKIYGCITAFFYTLSMTVIQNGLIKVQNYTQAELADAMANDPHMMLLGTWGSITQLIGGLSIPVFAFLLVEGFKRTHSLRGYMGRMALFAVISEVPYDFAIYGKAWSFDSQNVMVTYLICLVMLYGLSLFEGQRGGRFWVLRILITLASVLWVLLLRGQFGLVTVILVALYYLMYDNKGTRLVIGAAVSITYVTAPLSTYALWKFNGERGERYPKYLYYIIYPAHLLILGAIAYFMAK